MNIHIDWTSGTALVTDAYAKSANKHNQIGKEMSMHRAQTVVLEYVKDMGFTDINVRNESDKIIEFVRRVKSGANFERPEGQYVFKLKASGIQNKPWAYWPREEDIRVRNEIFDKKKAA